MATDELLVTAQVEGNALDPDEITDDLWEAVKGQISSDVMLDIGGEVKQLKKHWGELWLLFHLLFSGSTLCWPQCLARWFSRY